MPADPEIDDKIVRDKPARWIEAPSEHGAIDESRRRTASKADTGTASADIKAGRHNRHFI